MRNIAFDISKLPNVVTGSTLEKRQRRPSQQEEFWEFETCRGRTVELHTGASPDGGAAGLSFAFTLIENAQTLGEPCAWISATQSLFFPPDAEQNGICLDALPIIETQSPKDAARCAERLLKSGGFGCVVLDLGSDPWFPDALQARLSHHARTHHATALFLIEDLDTQYDARSLGPKTGLRLEAVRRSPDAPFGYLLKATKGQHSGAGTRETKSNWRHATVRYGTPGLR